MAESLDSCVSGVLPRWTLRPFLPTCSLPVLARTLQECSERLHLGPYGLLTASLSSDGELRLLRPRAMDVMEEVTELAGWRVLWRASLAEAPVVTTMGLNRRPCLQLPDGHGRLLIVCASLLGQLVSPDAHYPVVGSVSSSRNLLRLLRVLQEITSPGELRDIPIEDDDESCAVEQGEGDDLISRIMRVTLRGMQPHSHYSSDTTLTRQVLEGCIHFNMCTEVVDDVLITLRRLLLRFLWVSEPPSGRVASRFLAARARSVLADPASYILPCIGGSVVYSCNLPFGTFLLPTLSTGLTPHQGTASSFFAIERKDREQPQWVMLLRVDAEGDLLNFEHFRGKQGNDAESSNDGSEDGEEGRRDVEGLWTTAENDEAQLEAAQLLYQWAWAHGVVVILTPSHVPPVVKTYGRRYTINCTSTDGGDEYRPIFMVDEVEETVFDALLRRLQYWRHDISSDMYKALDAMPLCTTAAILRRGQLVLPDPAEDALLPVCRVVHGPLYALLKPDAIHSPAMSGSSDVRAVLLELDRSVFHQGVFCPTHSLAERMGSMVLVSPTTYQLRVYTALLLKCLRSVLTGLSPLIYTSEAGFVRAGGALTIALSRQMRIIAEVLKRQMQRITTTNNNNAAIIMTHNYLDVRLPVIAAVLQMLSNALLEVPRRLAAHITSRHRPLRQLWLRFEGDEMRREKSCVFGSIALSKCPPLHVYLREDVNFYRSVFRPPLNDVCTDGGGRRYFCRSDTESSESESDDEETSRRDALHEPLSFSFVEPIAATTGVLRNAITLLRLTLLSEAGACESVSL